MEGASQVTEPGPLSEGQVEEVPQAPDTGPSEPVYHASIFPGSSTPLDPALGAQLAKLKASLGMPLWLVVQADDHDTPFPHLDDPIVRGFRHVKDDLPVGGEIALVVNSSGGEARVAFQLARLINRRCGSYTAVVPDHAMSAATLLALGAKSIVMGPDACLGPLDAQIWDPDTEKYGSALNEVQALERLRAFALESVDAAMFLLVGRTGKRVSSLLPDVVSFVGSMMNPLLTEIDVVHYNEQARILKVAEEYAVRLLGGEQPTFVGHPLEPRDSARQIASALVERYPEHGFPIDHEEAGRLGLPVSELTDEQSSLLEDLWPTLQGITAIGEFQEAAAL
jgi:hypothetical protein